MNRLTRISVYKGGLQAAYFGRRRGSSVASQLDFLAAKADTSYIYSPLDTPQGLRRGSVFLGSPSSFGSAWEVSHAR